MRAVVSDDAVTINEESAEKTQSHTHILWPVVMKVAGSVYTAVLQGHAGVSNRPMLAFHVRKGARARHTPT